MKLFPRFYITAALTIVWMVLGGSFSAFAASPPQAETILREVIAARISGHEIDLLVETDSSLMSRLQTGYDLKPFGKITIRHQQTYLFHLRPKDGGDALCASVRFPPESEKCQGVSFRKFPYPSEYEN